VDDTSHIGDARARDRLPDLGADYAAAWAEWTDDDSEAWATADEDSLSPG
jgi:hypothetical protein